MVRSIISFLAIIGILTIISPAIAGKIILEGGGLIYPLVSDNQGGNQGGYPEKILPVSQHNEQNKELELVAFLLTEPLMDLYKIHGVKLVKETKPGEGRYYHFREIVVVHKGKRYTIWITNALEGGCEKSDAYWRTDPNRDKGNCEYWSQNFLRIYMGKDGKTANWAKHDQYLKGQPDYEEYTDNNTSSNEWGDVIIALNTKFSPHFSKSLMETFQGKTR